MARLPKSLIKKYGISKKAWSIFKGRKRRSPTRRTKKVGRKRGGIRRMARRRWYRRKRRGGGKSMTRTAFKLIRIGALAAPAIYRITQPLSTPDKVNEILADYTGFNMQTGRMDFGRLMNGWGAFLGACLATYGIPKITSIIRRL